MAILSIMLSVIAAPMVRTIEATRFIRTSEAILSDLRAYRTEALISSQNMIVISSENQIQKVTQSDRQKIRYFDIPEGWSVKGGPIYILKSGYCLGGEIEFNNGSGRDVYYTLAPPHCTVKRKIAPVPQG